MIDLVGFLAGVLIISSWLAAIINCVDLIIHSPVVLFLARTAPQEHKIHYLTAFSAALFAYVMVLFEPTLESFVASMGLILLLTLIHTADQLIFESRRDLPPIEAACHASQLLMSGLSSGLYIGYVMVLWSGMDAVPRGFVLREFGPWAWSYVPFLAVTPIGIFTHGLEMVLARGPKKENERWKWPLSRVLRSPIFWLPKDRDERQQVAKAS